jgi:transmembrane sensor
VTEPVEQRAALFLLSREDPDWSPQQEDEFETWLAVSDRHKAVFWRLEQGWRAADRVTAIGIAPLPTPLLKTVIRIFMWPAVAAIAASLLIVVSAGIMVEDPQVPRYEQFTTLGQRRTLSFQDGSKIELNAYSQVHVAMNGRSRLVTLDRGEAFFDVRHDEQRPFVVQAGGHQVTDLGTEFVVRRNDDGIMTAVLEGEVELAPSKKTVRAAHRMKQGDWAVVRGSALYVHPRDLYQVEAMLGWRKGLIIFNHARLAEAARDFNRYNDVKLVIADPAVAAIRIDGAFKTGNIDGFSRLMRDAYGLRVEKQGTRIILSGE